MSLPSKASHWVQPIGSAPPSSPGAPSATLPGDEPQPEIFVWFEDLQRCSGLGAAGLLECLLPRSTSLRVLERRYAEDHLHLLRAVRLRCTGPAETHLTALYVGALAAGTLAYILTGRRGREAWNAMYGDGAI